jgi:hypothetical protein
MVASTANASLMVDIYKSTSTVSSMTVAEALLSDTPTVSGTYDVINFWDNKYNSNGWFDDDLSFEITSLDNFAVHVTGFIIIDVDGYYTFGTQSDDGVRLTIGDQVIINNPTLHASETDLYSMYLTAGTYSLDLIFYEKSGAASLELFSAYGTYSTFDSSAFTLLGAENGIQTSSSVPEPTTMLLFVTGIAGFAAVFRKKRK